MRWLHAAECVVEAFELDIRFLRGTTKEKNATRLQTLLNGTKNPVRLPRRVERIRAEHTIKFCRAQVAIKVVRRNLKKANAFLQASIQAFLRKNVQGVKHEINSKDITCFAYNVG